MSIKAGQLVTTGDTVLIERLQTGGPGVNVPSQRINELGNYKAVAVSHDIPDLSFNMESYDATCAMEELLTKQTAGSGPFLISAPKAIDVASEWLAGQDDPAEFAVVEAAAIPFLLPDSIQYRFGLRDQATQTVNLRGDSIYYCPGAAVVEKFTGSGSAGQALALTHPAGLYNGDLISGSRRTLNVTANGIRLIYGVDYTETITGGSAPFNVTTVHITAAVASGAPITVTYFTNDAVSYDATVHTAPSVKPAAVRGRDITVLLNGTSVTDRWTGVQQASIDCRFDIQRDEELGNAFAVATEYTQAPNVTGSVSFRARTPAALHAQMRKLFNIATSTEAIGAQTFYENDLVIVLHHPDTGAVLKALHVPDAVMTLPGFTGRANTIVDVPINFESDSGTLEALDDLSEWVLNG